MRSFFHASSETYLAALQQTFSLVGGASIPAVQGVCSSVSVDTEKSVLKQNAVQHLYGRLSGKLLDNQTDSHLLVHPIPGLIK